MNKVNWPGTQEERLHLARQMFELIGGRRDVFAHHYDFKSKESGEQVKGWATVRGRRVAADYQPEEGEQVTKNKRTGDNHLCQPFTEEELVKHLRGQKRFGVYPISREETVRFLATDFDDHDGSLDPDAVWGEVKAFWTICEAQNFRAHIERSKSGTGYHVWIFFDGDVTAQKARGVGRWLMEEAGAVREEDDFSTFDRFFPSQPFLSAGGFGNLIGLPMRGAWEYAKGLCAWVDPDSGETIPDGPEYLAAILANGRVPADYVDEFISEDPDSIILEDKNAIRLEPKRARDPNQKLGTVSEADEVFKRCKFMNWASDPEHQSEVKEPLWFSMLTNGARFDIDDRLHDASSNHSGYSSGECQDKINHARDQMPAGCDVIRRDGFNGCPAGGCKLPNNKTVVSPAGLSAWSMKERRPSYDPMAGNGDDYIPDEPEVIASDRPVVELVEETTTEPSKPVVKLEAASTRSVSVTDSGVTHDDSPWGKEVELDPDTKMPWPTVFTEEFDLDTDGLRRMVRVKGEYHPGELIALNPIWVDSMAQDEYGEWFVVVKFFDFDWKLMTTSFPASRLSESGGKLGMELRADGAVLLAGKEKWLCRFLDMMAATTKSRALVAKKLGWFMRRGECAFVLPDAVLGETKSNIIFPHSAQQDFRPIRSQGNHQDWVDHIAKPCAGNPLLMFAIMAALAGPVLQFANVESGGFHFHGNSSKGKTTLHQVAASVWGEGSDPQEGGEHSFIRKWYQTGNSLEGTAQMHHNLVLCIDEISQADGQELGNLIYMLAGGQPKGRMTQDGALRRQQTWRLFFLSNGEKTIKQIMEQAKQNVKGGQRHRLPDIPIETNDGAPLLIMDAHGKTHEKFAQDIKYSSSTYFGTAGPVLAAYLAGKVKKDGSLAVREELRGHMETLETMLLEGVDLPSDARRVVRRMAAVALAGCLSGIGFSSILPWTVEEIQKAVVSVRDLWIQGLGDERSEEDRALTHLRKTLLTSMHRFKNVEHMSEIPEMLGFRCDDYLMPLTDTFYDLTGEFDDKMILRELRKRDLLWSEPGRLARKSPVIKGQKERPRVYFIRRSFLGEVDEAGVKQKDTYDYPH